MEISRWYMKTIKAYVLQKWEKDSYANKEITTDFDRAKEWFNSSKDNNFEVFPLTLPVQVQSDY